MVNISDDAPIATLPLFDPPILVCWAASSR